MRCLSVAVVSTCAALHDAARACAGIFFSLHVFGQVLPMTERLLQFAEILCLTQLLIVKVVISRFNVALGANSPSIPLLAYASFLQLVLVLFYHFKGVWCCRHPWTQEQFCSNQHYCRRDRPLIVRTVGKRPCSDAILPTLVRLESPLHVNTSSAILQQSALL